jgi:hypothetical protein
VSYAKEMYGLIFRWVMLLAALMVTMSHAAVTNWPALTSHQRHFVVDGVSPQEALEIATWAESTLDRLAGWSGMAWPEEGVLPMIIAVEAGKDGEAGRVASLQVLTDDGRLRQELLLVNPDDLSQEDALETLCELLMNRWLFREARRRGMNDYAGRVPGWMAVAAARNLYPEARLLNLRELKEAERRGYVARADAVFALPSLPPGRSPEKALAALVMHWLVEEAGASVLLSRLIDLQISYVPADPGSIADLTGLDSARAFNMAWEVWLAEQDRRVVPGQWSTETADLIRLLELHPQDVGLVSSMSLPGGRLDYRQLIEARDRPWARGAARIFATKLRLALMGKDPALVEVAQPFATFFDALAEGTGSRGRDRLPDVALRSMWEDATASFAVYLLTKP